MFQALVYSERHTYLLYFSSILYLCFFVFWFVCFFLFFFFFGVCCLFFDFLIKLNLFFFCIEDVSTPCEKCYLIWTNITLVFFTIFFYLFHFIFLWLVLKVVQYHVFGYLQALSRLNKYVHWKWMWLSDIWFLLTFGIETKFWCKNVWGLKFRFILRCWKLRPSALIQLRV